MLFFKRRRKEKEDAGRGESKAAEASRPSPPAEEAGPIIYLLMNSEGGLVGRGRLESPPEAPSLQINMTDGAPMAAVQAEVVQCIPSAQSRHSVIGRVIARRGTVVVIDPLREAGSQMRQNFRMPMDFESFAYPLYGGRADIKAVDLSCGGIAFSSGYPFTEGEDYEIVIPCTEPGPLIMLCRILRSRPGQGAAVVYAGQFQDVLYDQESMLREAVFNAQIQSIMLAKVKR